MRYISSPGNDAYFNMALEEYVFECLPRDEEYFILWQNANAVVVGKYQNTLEEIDRAYVEANGISVVRRLSGGGAMYQDLGNLNFTFVVNQDAAKSLDFGLFIRPVIHALAQIGVVAELNSRNDIVIEGKKFSGNSQYNKKGRTMHHGTLLFDSDLEVIGRALQVKQDKIESKGIKSVHSRVTNIRDHLRQPITMEEFRGILLAHMFDANAALETYELTAHDLAEIQRLRDEKYATWAWVYGRSPACNVRKYRRYGFGGITVQMQVEQGEIRSLVFSGDFFGNGELEELAALLVGCPLRQDAVLAALRGVDVGYYISGMEAEPLAELLVY